MESSKNVTHPSHLLVSQNKTEQICLTFTVAFTSSDVLVSRCVGASLLELNTRQTRWSPKKNTNEGRKASKYTEKTDCLCVSPICAQNETKYNKELCMYSPPLSRCCDLSRGTRMSSKTNTIKIWVRDGCTVKIWSCMPASRLAYLHVGQTNAGDNPCFPPPQCAPVVIVITFEKLGG